MTIRTNDFTPVDLLLNYSPRLTKLAGHCAPQARFDVVKFQDIVVLVVAAVRAAAFQL